MYWFSARKILWDLPLIPCRHRQGKHHKSIPLARYLAHISSQAYFPTDSDAILQSNLYICTSMGHSFSWTPGPVLDVCGDSLEDHTHPEALIFLLA